MFACRWFKQTSCHYGFISLISWPRQILQTFVSTTTGISLSPIRFSIEERLVKYLLKCGLASVSPAFFQLRLEFCYGQEKQLVFVQAFSKINKVSIDDFLCSQFNRNPIDNNSDSISKSYHLTSTPDIG